ncbi:hypothetical protein, partial [Enterocloster sp.]|uniref:hypothetical protein n=1 Tax=Enterocloster sp. TaxID=2719315 RepID=UPI00284CD934
MRIVEIAPAGVRPGQFLRRVRLAAPSGGRGSGGDPPPTRCPSGNYWFIDDPPPAHCPPGNYWPGVVCR